MNSQVVSDLLWHDSKGAFRINRNVNTIVAKDEGIVFGIAQELSPLDIIKANTLYECGKKCSIICVNS